MTFELIKFPLITEKALGLIEKNKYSFAVDPKANKKIIKSTLEELFSVSLKSVNTTYIPVQKRRPGGGRRQRLFGTKPRYKKAIVTLSPGATLNLFEEE